MAAACFDEAGSDLAAKACDQGLDCVTFGFIVAIDVFYEFALGYDAVAMVREVSDQTELQWRKLDRPPVEQHSHSPRVDLQCANLDEGGGVPPDAAGAARDTLRGAVGAAEELSGPLAGDLLGAAVEAFSRALQLTAGTSAVLVLAAAILVALLLRNVPAGSGSEDPASPEPDAASQDSAGVGGSVGPGSPATETPENLVSEREGT